MDAGDQERQPNVIRPHHQDNHQGYKNEVAAIAHNRHYNIAPNRHATGNVPEFDAVEQIGCAAGRNQINDGIFRNGCRARLARPADKDLYRRRSND
jgi:hypothetical protein